MPNALTATLRARLPWFSVDDVNGFCGLAVDNLAVMGILAAVLVGIYHMPSEIVFGREGRARIRTIR